jgi:SseB protein N-terminal domain
VAAPAQRTAELLRQLARASAAWDAAAEADLVRALAAATLLVPVREEPGGGRGAWATTDEEGRPQVVAFTDPAAVEAWAGRPTPYAVMTGVDVCAVAVRADAAALWIDPGARHGARLDRRMVGAVAGGLALGSDAP